jgi:acetyl esterase/lipase
MKRSLAFTATILLIILTLSGCNQKDLKQSADTNSLAASGLLIEPTFDINIEHDIIYATVKNVSGEEENLTLDLYQPTNDGEENRPAIVFIHGGSLSEGSKEDSFMCHLSEEFAKRGYVTMSINYRLRADPYNDYNSTLKDAAEDAAAAIDWLKSNSSKYHIDPNCITVAGNSAGAAIALSLGYHKTNSYNGLKAVISISGRDSFQKNVTKESPHCILIHGKIDQTVPYQYSENLAKEFKHAGAPYTLYPIENAEHSMNYYRNEVTDVITKHLYAIHTGNEIDIPIRKQQIPDVEKVYSVKQITLTLDGKLDEWENAKKIQLNQLKDEGDVVPQADDFSGTVMLGWNQSEPEKLYFAASVVDDIAQYDADDFWQNDCFEIMINLFQDGQRSSVVRWVLSTDGETLASDASTENTDWVVIRSGNHYTIEAVMDISLAPKSALPIYHRYKGEPGLTLFMSIQFNDGENGRRETQIGWTAGPAWNLNMFGTAILEE